VSSTTKTLTTPQQPLAIGHGVVNYFETFFHTVLSHIKASLGGEVSVDGLDSIQIVSYEVAMLNAEIFAAKSVLDYASRCAEAHRDCGFESDLACCCVAELMGTIRARLEEIKFSVGLDDTALTSVYCANSASKFARRYLDPGTIDQTGREAIRRMSFGRSLLEHDKEIIASSCGRFSNEVVALLAEKIHRNDLTVPEEILAPLREMGCLGLSIPERYGGTSPDAGADHLAMVVVTEELSRASLAAAGSLITRPEIMGKAIFHGGTETRRTKWLPKIAAGEPLCGIAATEPDAGSDVAAMRFKARRSAGGWLLNGSKTWSTFAGKSGILLVLARTNPDLSLAHKGLSLFIVEKPTTEEKGFSFSQTAGGKMEGAAIPTIGYRGMHSFTLFFDDWFVPDENLIGGDEAEGRGFYLTMKAFAGGRLHTAARANGLMRAAFEQAVTYAQTHRVFGKAMSEYQLTRAKVAQMAWNLRACHEMTDKVATLMDAETGHIEASPVNLYACRAAEAVTRKAVQIHGGMGYSEETLVSRYYVDARLLSIFEGAEETLALKVVAKELITNATQLAFL
jgi:(2S)-methylsuccinyl-CoA dehydrogenase